MFETPVKQLNSALALLNRKSEEISSLRASAAEQDKARATLYDRIASLETENETLKETITELHQASHAGKDDEDQLSSMTNAFDSMTIERDSLMAEITLLKIARDDALKHADLFRD